MIVEVWNPRRGSPTRSRLIYVMKGERRAVVELDGQRYICPTSWIVR